MGNDQSRVDGVFYHDLTVPENTIDQNGHVNNVAYVQWMQDVASLHSDATGGTMAVTAAGGAWVVRYHKIEYLSPAFAGDWLQVATWVVNFRRVRSLRQYRFVNVASGKLLAKGETDWVFVDGKSGRPRRIDPIVEKAFILVPDEPEPR
jgi:acyl-CoA thioester hydrolase